MKRTLISIFVIIVQLVAVAFFGMLFLKNNDIKNLEYVNVSHNVNLDKIATSVSLLFKDEKVVLVDDQLFDESLNDLPSIDVVQIDDEIEEVENNEPVSVPLYTLDASKYKSRPAMGFKVTEGNKKYDLTDQEFDVVVAVVAGEFDKTIDDALGVMSVILNRCDSASWSKWFGTSPYKQVIGTGQFEVYFAGMYKDYMPGGKYYEKKKYNMAKQAVLDGLNGIRNNDYLGFRASWVTGYSDKYIVSGGNRYGYN